MDMTPQANPGVDDDEPKTAAATEMTSPAEPSDAARRHHELSHLPFQPWCEHCVRGRAPDPPKNTRVRDEIVIQVDYCFMKTRPQDDLITTLVGVDDSFGRCVAICVERKGARDVLGVKVLSAFARSLGQPRLVIQSDGEPAILELARETCDVLPCARQQVTPTASKGSNGRVEQANKVVEGMARTIVSCFESRYEIDVATGHPGRFDTLHGCWNDSNLVSMASQGTTDNISGTIKVPSFRLPIVLWRDPWATHTQTSIQVGSRSVVGQAILPVRASEVRRDAAKLTDSGPRAPEHEGTSGRLAAHSTTEGSLDDWRLLEARKTEVAPVSEAKKTHDEPMTPGKWQFRRHHVSGVNPAKRPTRIPPSRGRYRWQR